jgi:hypothetical protein
METAGNLLLYLAGSCFEKYYNSSNLNFRMPGIDTKNVRIDTDFLAEMAFRGNIETTWQKGRPLIIHYREDGISRVK